MREIQIAEAPIAFKDQLKRHSSRTFEVHRAKRAKCLPQNVFKDHIAGSIDASF